MTVLLIALVLAIAALLTRALLPRLQRPSARTPMEVATILKGFAAGEPTRNRAEHFIYAPIADRRLNAIRADFQTLVDSLETWKAQAPFPPSAVPALRVLIDRAEALANEVDAALREFSRWTRDGEYWKAPPDTIDVPISLGSGGARLDDEVLTVAVSAVDRFRQLETKARAYIDAQNVPLRVGDVDVLEVIRLANPWAFSDVPPTNAFNAGEPAVILTFAIIDDRDVVDVVFWKDDAVGWDAH